jgi:hypothetical protein
MTACPNIWAFQVATRPSIVEMETRKSHTIQEFGGCNGALENESDIKY